MSSPLGHSVPSIYLRRSGFGYLYKRRDDARIYPEPGLGERKGLRNAHEPHFMPCFKYRYNKHIQLQIGYCLILVCAFQRVLTLFVDKRHSILYKERKQAQCA